MEQAIKILPGLLSHLPDLIGHLEYLRSGITPAAGIGCSDVSGYGSRTAESNSQKQYTSADMGSKVSNNDESQAGHSHFFLAQDDAVEAITNVEPQKQHSLTRKSPSPLLQRPKPLRPGTLLPEDSRNRRNRTKNRDALVRN